jgi:hypothetical protein
MSTTKTKSKSTKTAPTGTTADSRPEKKAVKKDVVVPAPVSGPVPPALNDTRADDQPVVGHSVEVTKGDDKGFFGVFVEAEGDNAVLRGRGDAGVRKVVPLADVVPASPYRR